MNTNAFGWRALLGLLNCPSIKMLDTHASVAGPGPVNRHHHVVVACFACPPLRPLFPIQPFPSIKPTHHSRRTAAMRLFAASVFLLGAGQSLGFIPGGLHAPATAVQRRNGPAVAAAPARCEPELPPLTSLWLVLGCMCACWTLFDAIRGCRGCPIEMPPHSVCRARLEADVSSTHAPCYLGWPAWPCGCCDCDCAGGWWLVPVMQRLPAPNSELMPIRTTPPPTPN